MKPAEESRVTPGGIAYTLTHKRVKNINLHLRADGTAVVSTAARVPAAEADAFVDRQRAWIARARVRAARRAAAEQAPLPDRAAALAAFTRMSELVLPAFADVLGTRLPVIKVRDMRTRWGVCCPAKRQITFALRLYDMPPAAQVYVVVHEFCHFRVADHSPAFWREVERTLPDWKARRRLLRR